MKMNIRDENEFKRLQLTLLYGYESNIPYESPEQESEALDMFLKMAKQETIKIYNKIGKPEFKAEELLSDDDVKVELERINSLLLSHNLCLDFALNDHDPRDVYRFIINEFFTFEVPKFYTIAEIDHYLYEDYVITTEIEVKMLCLGFWEIFCVKDFKIDFDIRDYDNNLAFEVFRNQYDSFEINHLQILSLNFSEDNLVLDILVKIDLDGIMEDINTRKNYSGTSNMRLEKIEGSWETIRVDLPG